MMMINGASSETGAHSVRNVFRSHGEPVVTNENTGNGGDASALPQEFLTFIVGREEYAIDILKVQEIRGYEPPTTIANAPAILKGVINLRGSIVPIVDMRIKFQVEKVEYTPFTVVVILSIGGRQAGIVVDSVSEVIMLRADQIQPPPEFSTVVDDAYILGIGTLANRMLLVMDIDKLMFSGEMALAKLESLAVA